VERGEEIGGGKGAGGGGESGLDAAGELVEGGLDGGVEVLTAVVVELGDGEVGLVGPELGAVAPGEGLVAEVGDEELALVAGAVPSGGVDEARPGGVVELLSPDHVARSEAADHGSVGIRRARVSGRRGVLAGAAAAALGWRWRQGLGGGGGSGGVVEVDAGGHGGGGRVRVWVWELGIESIRTELGWKGREGDGTGCPALPCPAFCSPALLHTPLHSLLPTFGLVLV